MNQVLTVAFTAARYFKVPTIIGALGVALGLQCFSSRSDCVYAEEYTPESPKVKEMVARGVDFLESRYTATFGVGYETLVGYAVFKATDDPEHRWVKKGLLYAEKVAATPVGKDIEQYDEYVYAVSVAIQLMAAVDPVKYAPQLQKMLSYLQDRQRSDGAYGYKYKESYTNTGDTSQTQYALLGLWSLDHAQVKVPPEMVEKAFNWLRSTQYGDGGFGYQAPSNSYPPNHVMTAVGMSAAMIAGDILQVLRQGGGSAVAALDEAENNQDFGVPAAFRRVVEDPAAKLKTGVNQSAVASVADKADRWIGARTYQRQPSFGWHYYWLYSIERYQAFREAMKGRREKSPAWYNEIVEQLAKTQSDEGAWGRKDPDAGSAESCTAFAILVLLRTTQKSIGELNEAVATGGFGLKADMSSVDFSSGKVEDKKQLTDIEAALQMLENEKFDKDVSSDLAKRIRLDPDAEKRNQQLERFARLLRSDSAISRRVAAKILCRGDNLEMVPHLIYALTDPDGITNMNAENSLRVLSRQMGTYKIPKALPENSLEFPLSVRLEAQAYWKNWYLSVRPDYIFLQSN